MKENILILVNSFISCSKNQYFKTQLINTEHRTQNTDTEHRTQTHVKNVLDFFSANISKEVRNKTFRRSNPSEESIRILKEKLKLEYDLFHFVQQRFNEQFQLLKRSVASNK